MKVEKDVQSIRNQQQLDDMKWALKRNCSERDYILFIMGCEGYCHVATDPPSFPFFRYPAFYRHYGRRHE